jgi:hypothetical protein
VKALRKINKHQYLGTHGAIQQKMAMTLHKLWPSTVLGDFVHRNREFSSTTKHNNLFSFLAWGFALAESFDFRATLQKKKKGSGRI